MRALIDNDNNSGYTCAYACNRDPRCQWRGTTCINIKSNLPNNQLGLRGICNVTRSSSTASVVPTSSPGLYENKTPDPTTSPTPSVQPTLFTIDIVYDNTSQSDPDIVQAYEIGIQNWTNIVTWGFPSYIVLPPGNYCNSIDIGSLTTFTIAQRIDNLLVIAKIHYIDGEGGVWAQTGVVGLKKYTR